MKKILSILLTLVLVLGLCACGGGEGGSSGKDGLQVGFGRKSILPDIVGVEIAGGDASSRISTGYMDDLTVSCIAMSEGDKTVLLYTIDIITVDKHVYAAQETISQATGIPVENIILNATHDHSAVSIRSNWDGADAYRIKFNQAAADAGVAAIADLSAAEVYYAGADTQNLTATRHYKMNDGTSAGIGHGTFTGSNVVDHLYKADTELQVIKFARKAEDKKDIVLMNLGAHATITNGTNKDLLSSDWPGAARDYVEANTDSLCAVFEAAAGDQNPGSSSRVSGYCDVDNTGLAFGTAVGEACVGVLSGEMTKSEGAGINLKVQTYTGATMKEGAEDAERVAQAKEVKSLVAQYGSSSLEVSAAVTKYGFYNVYEATGIASRASYPETYSMELHAMTVDGISFIFAPYEMFGASGKDIKDNSPYDMTFIVTCSENGSGNYHMGYMPTILGCEESFYEYDVTKFARGTAEDLAKTYVEMLTEMKGA